MTLRALMVAALLARTGSTFTACTSDTSNTTRFQLGPCPALTVEDTIARGPGGNITGRPPIECGLLAPYGRYVKAADGGTILYVEIPKVSYCSLY